MNIYLDLTDIENTESNNKKAKLVNEMNQVKMKKRNLILVTWSGLNMVRLSILLKYVV